MRIIEIRSRSNHSAYSFPADEVAYVSIDKGGPRRFPMLVIELRSGRVIRAVATKSDGREADEYNELVGLYTEITNGMSDDGDLQTYKGIGIIRSDQSCRGDAESQRWAEARELRMRETEAVTS